MRKMKYTHKLTLIGENYIKKENESICLLQCLIMKIIWPTVRVIPQYNDICDGAASHLSLINNIAFS